MPTVSGVGSASATGVALGVGSVLWPILTLPTTYFSALDLEPDHMVSIATDRGGYAHEITWGDPMWVGSMTTTKLSERELRQWEAFIADSTERKLPFDFVHPTKTLPIEYQAGLPFSGNMTVTSLADLTAPVLSGFTVGLQLRKGDRIAFIERNFVSHRMLRTDLLVSSATAQAVPIVPRLPLGVFTTAATATIKNPPMRLRVQSNTWQASLQAGDAPTGSFKVFEFPKV